MGGELVEGEPPFGGGGLLPPARPKFSEVFRKWLPYYMSIGMTPEEYWHGDPTLTEAYREADEFRKERENFMAWLQGMYFYDALGAVAPIMRSFAKRGTRANPYVEQPYPLTKMQQEITEEQHEKAVMEKGKRMMAAFMAAQKARQEQKGAEDK